MDVGMQLEVVLPAKELLADLALELAASTVGGDVAAQVPLTGEHLLAVRAGEVVCCCLQMVLQGFRSGVLIYTLHTSKCREKRQSL